MSNVNSIRIIGQLPFNCVEESFFSESEDAKALHKFLTTMNAPFGIRIHWYKRPKMISNEFNGKTAVYKFILEGKEALPRPCQGGTCGSLRGNLRRLRERHRRFGRS